MRNSRARRTKTRCTVGKYPLDTRKLRREIATLFIAAIVLIGSTALSLPTAADPLPQVTKSSSRTPLITAGYIEWAWLDKGRFAIKAKLDTGAKTSSLHATNLTTFTKNETPWIRFSIPDRNGQQAMLELPVVRIAHIRRAGASISKRPVVRMIICVAGKTTESEITLTDRQGMDYSLLIGRSFLRTRILVDSTTTYIGGELCSKPNSQAR